MSLKIKKNRKYLDLSDKKDLQLAGINCFVTKSGNVGYMNSILPLII